MYVDQKVDLYSTEQLDFDIYMYLCAYSTFSVYVEEKAVLDNKYPYESCRNIRTYSGCQIFAVENVQTISVLPSSEQLYE